MLQFHIDCSYYNRFFITTQRKKFMRPLVRSVLRSTILRSIPAFLVIPVPIVYLSPSLLVPVLIQRQSVPHTQQILFFYVLLIPRTILLCMDHHLLPAPVHAYSFVADPFLSRICIYWLTALITFITVHLIPSIPWELQFLGFLLFNASRQRIASEISSRLHESRHISES